MEQEKTFSFGQNWQTFLKSIDQDRVKVAQSSLTDFMHLPDLRGRTFLDIGCGSGLFSLAAYHLGAERIISFDADPFSAECCRRLHSGAGNPSNWEILDGSVLDRDFLARLGTFDIVYAWGVLHHTGKMWEAVANSVDLVKPGGLYYIALYNRLLGRDGATSWIHSFWLAVKKLYNNHALVGRYILEPPALMAYLAIVAARGENPIMHIKNYKSHRGMSWRTDATDWLGGYPYEFATVEEVFTFVRSKSQEFELVNIKVTGGRGLNWFLFRRRDTNMDSKM